MIIDGIQLPDFMIAGAAKSGTTTISQYLSKHPDIYIPEIKELFYFSFNDEPPIYTSKRFREKVVWKREDYLKQYAHLHAHVRLGDASTSYLYTAPISVQHIRRVYGLACRDLRIIIILRNPVDRAFSHYTHLVRNGFENLSFDEALQPAVIERRKKIMWGFDYRAYGLYAQQVKLFSEAFPHLKVLLFEDLEDMPSLLAELHGFLGVKHIAATDMVIHANPSGIPKNPGAVRLMRDVRIKRFVRFLMPVRYRAHMMRFRDHLLTRVLERPVMAFETRKQLADYYRSDIMELEKILQRDLSHWI